MVLAKGITHKTILKTFSNLPSRLFKVHGTKYTYDNAIFSGVKKEFIATCSKHGDWSTTVDRLVNARSGCPLCSGIYTGTTATFIAKSKELYGTMFSYASTNYTCSSEAVVVTCSQHGDFTTIPAQHLTGTSGCKMCAGRVYDTSSFISKATTVHASKYKYNKVAYSTAHRKVVITCPIHGDFKQTPNSHLAGKGCTKCSSTLVGNKKRKTSNTFAHEANKVHHGAYTYGPYVSAHTKICITCKEHGEFFQTPRNHLAGTACPGCSSGGFNPNKPAILYYLSINNGKAYKIGITNRTVKKRYSPEDRKKISILAQVLYINGNDARLEEQRILTKYQHFKYKGKPLLATGNTELFYLDVLNFAGPH